VPQPQRYHDILSELFVVKAPLALRIILRS
jgi:hypothetical protein